MESLSRSKKMSLSSLPAAGRLGAGIGEFEGGFHGKANRYKTGLQAFTSAPGMENMERSSLNSSTSCW